MRCKGEILVMVAPLHCIGKPMTNSRLLPTHGATQTTTPLSCSLSWWILMKEELRHFSRLEMGAVICEYMINTCTCIESHLRQFINPRRACAARVTVVILCVCPSVCLSVCLFVCLFVSIYSRTTGYEAAYERYQQLQCYKGRKNNVAILLKRSKPICIMSTGLPRPGLARSAHRGRIKFLRGYVSKSSAAVNRPTHDHAASL